MTKVKSSLLCLVLFVFSIGMANNNITPATNFEGLAINGNKISLADFRGKVVLIDFWASWCKPCQKELPFLTELYNQNKNKDFVVIAINLDEHKENMQKFLDDMQWRVRFPVIRDPKGKIPTLYKVNALPTTLLVDKKGYIRYQHKGFKDSFKPQYIEEVNSLLQDKVAEK